MTTAKSVSKVSMLEFLIVVVTLAVLTTLSDAFVHPPSVANIICPNHLLHNDFSTTNSCNDRTSSLFASTASSNNESGLAVIDSWKLLPDGRIKGVMADSGDSVMTSPLKNKNRLKEKSTVRTVSGSRYKLGTPSLIIGAGNNLSADRLGTPRATLGGINGNNNNVRATQPLQSGPTASQDGLLQNFLANKGRATMPLRSDSSESPFSANNNDDESPYGSDKINNLLTPLVGGASAIAIGAAIGNGVVSDKGIDLNKMKNLPDLSEVLKSTNSLGLPDLKSLKAPVIPTAGVSFPKFEGLPSVSAPKLPDIGIKFPNVNLPEGIKKPNLPSVTVPDGMKSLGDAAGGAVENALESTGIKFPTSPFAKKIPQITSVGQSPYRVPMPYLDQKIVDAEKEQKIQEAAEAALAAEKEEAARMQRIRQEAETEVIARQNMEREQESEKRAKEEARIRQEADERVKIAEQETARLRNEVEQTRFAALAKEKAAAEEAARFKKEAEVAILKEQAAKEEFTRKLQEAELAKLKEAQDFAVKLAEAEEAAAKERALEEESIVKQRLAEEAVLREAAATAKVRKASIGATAARKASYSSPSLSTYEAWQDRQRTGYQMRIESITGTKDGGGVALSPPSSSSQDTLSTYKKWQQIVAAKQLVSMSTKPVTAAYITGAPAPVANQLVSGTTKLSEAAIALNGDLGYVIAGSAALIGGITYANEYKKIQDELSQFEEMQSASSESVSPPSSTSVRVQPLPPIVPPSSMVQVKQEDASSATMAVDAKPNIQVLGDESASVTKEVSPPPPINDPYTSFGGPPTSTTSASVTTEVAKRVPTAPTTPNVNNNGRSYLESMSKSSDANEFLKSSYSPFSNPKKTSNNGPLYDPPSTSTLMPQTEEKDEEPSTLVESSAPNTLEFREPYLKSMSGSGDSPKTSFETSETNFNDYVYTSPAENTDDESTSAANGGSYFDSMQNLGGNGVAKLKASYSPFGTPKVATNKSLYGPPSTPSVPEQQESFNPQLNEESYLETPISSIPETVPISSFSPVSGASYLERISGSDETKTVTQKTSFSPFSTRKTSQTKGDSLYDPPVAANEDLNTSQYLIAEFPEATTSNEDSYLSALNDSTGSNLKKSYAPFGTKPKAVSDNGLYSPGNFYKNN